MQIYTAPLRDMRFVLNELHQDDGFGDLPGQEEITQDLTDAVLEEAARLCQDVLLPLNRSGDEEGCHLENGVVRTPAGFIDAYRQFTQGGWSALVTPTQWGGQGLPEALGKLVEEMICATNVSFSLYPGLTNGAIFALHSYANEALKSAYLPKMVSGQWTGAMCLTEAHCGTDLGLLRSKAEPDGEDEFGARYKVSGAKIFISAGEHDLAENIIHLVLARLPDAPQGVKGISLFLVPKRLPDSAGNPGPANGVSCTAIEHKMGIKASATCQMLYDGSVGWLVGQPHRGLEAMFTMMNAERVGVGIQGLGIGEAAYQSAVWYAKDRLQGRSLSGAKQPQAAADPIIVHPDVRRMLLTMRAYNEGCRALSGWVSRALDAERHAAEPEARERAADFVALMTPVVKALFTDLGLESASLAVQTYGGHGFIRESGVEQYMRDARIAMLYEGTNGIQALDLVGRKLPAHMGRYLRSLFHPIANFIAAQEANAAIAPFVTGLKRAFEALQGSTALIAQRGMKDREEGGAAATDYLRQLGLTAMAYCFAKSADIATKHLAAGTGEAEFYQAKLNTARFFFDRILPQTTACYLAIKSGKASLMAMDEAMF